MIICTNNDSVHSQAQHFDVNSVALVAIFPIANAIIFE